MQRRVSRVGSICLVVLIAAACLVSALDATIRAADASNPRWLWTHQLGTSSYDAGSAIALDAAGSSYIAGTTASSIPGAAETNAGGFDAFVAKYDAAGIRLWTHLLGSVAADQGAGVSVDGQGNVYLVGNTAANLPGAPETNLGLRDAFIAKYDSSGNRLWVHQLGTASDDVATAVASDSGGNVYIAGSTGASLPGAPEGNVGGVDAFAARFDAAGNRVWVHQLGSNASDNATGIAVGPNATVFLTGDVGGAVVGALDANAGASDVFLARYDAAGSRTWVHLLGSTNSDFGGGVAADTTGNIFVAGASLGTVAGSPEANAGNRDAVVAKYSASGAKLWVRQLGSSSNDVASSVAVDASGSVLFAGWSFGTAPGSFEANTGQSDVLVAKYDANGVRVRVHQLGSTNGTQDQAHGIALDAAANAHVVGWTQGTLKGSLDSTAGGSDAFVGILGATAPGPPTSVAATAGVASISVAFNAPLDDGGDAVANYSASCISSNSGVPGAGVGAVSPIVVANLTNGASYTCRVVATNSVGTSLPSNPSTSVVLPTIPSAPVIGTATAADAAISVAFIAGANGGLPVISFAATCSSTDGGVTATGSGAASPIAVTGLTNGRSYACVVTATNAVGTSGDSQLSNLVAPAGAPDPPTNVTATRGIGTVTVAFAAPANDGGSPILSYTTSCSSSNGGISAQITTTASPAVLSGLSNAKTYACAVTTTNAKGTSAPSLPSNTVILPGVPTAASIGTAVIGNTSIVVSFTPSFDGGSPVIQFSATCTSSNGGAPGATSGAASPLVVGGLSNGRMYACFVIAVNAVGASAPSAPSNAVVPADVPGVATSVTAADVLGGASVSFDPPGSDGGTPITGYSVTCTSSSGGIAGVSVGPASPIVVAGLTKGKSYACRVTAVNAVGAGTASAISNTVTIPSAPNAPTSISAVSGIASISVAFVAGADGGRPATGFVATCTSIDGGSPGSATHSVSPVVVSALTNGSNYQCTVHAVNAVGAGNVSIASNVVVPAGFPDAPTSVVATGAASSIQVAFLRPFDGGRAITQFTTSCTSSDGGVAGATNSPSSPSMVAGLTNGKSYTCTVSATNSVGVGLASVPSNPVIPAAVPAAPTTVAITAMIQSLRVSFIAPLDDGGNPISGYTVDCFSVDGGVVGSTNTASSPAVVSALTGGATYACTVTATNDIGVSTPSALSNVVQLAALPEAPRIGRAASGNGAISVAFAPGFDGGEPVIRFDAACISFDGGIAGNASGLASPINVGLLTNGKSYTCEVVAVNAVGSSVASPDSNIVRLADTGTGGTAAFSFGAAFVPPLSSFPIWGDFNGDQKADVLWYAAGKNTDELWYGTASGFTVGTAISINGAYVPVVGDFDGDGKDDIVWYTAGAGADAVWRGTVSGFANGPKVSISGVYEPVVGDYDGDNRDDILWYGAGTASDALWYGAATKFRSGSAAVSLDATPIIGDFNGDGRDDVLWYGAGSAPDALMYGANAAGSSAFVPGPTIRVNGVFLPLVGDFDGNGRSDVVWYAPGSAQESVWLGAVNGFASGARINVSGTYLPIVQDFNGDGRTDVFWYRAGSASDTLWNGSDSGFDGGLAVAVGGTYEPITADFDGSGTGDILWFSAPTRRAPLWRGL